MSATPEPDPFAGSRQIDPSPLTQNEIDAALLDPGVFIDRHCWIRGPGGRTMPFRLFPYQWESLYAIAGNRFTFFLKARQLGISWLADAFILWLITANRGKSVLILSLGDAEAIEEMERIRFMWARLPSELRRRRGGQESGEGRNNLRRLEFPDMDSRVLSLATSEHAGTSYTATDVFVQELAKIDNADNVMAGIMPTMMDAPTGRLSVISTATGFGGVFSEIWNGSPEAPGIGQRWHSGQIVGDVGEPGEFVPIFIPWHARPGRDASYYATLQRTMPERKIKREYPATPIEAFAGSSIGVFSDEFDRYGDMVLDGSRAPDSKLPVVNSIDPGLNHAVGYLIEVYGDSAFVFDEVWEEDLTSPEMASKMIEAHQLHGLPTDQLMTYIDPYAIGRNTESKKTERDLYSEAGLLVDFDETQTPPEQRVKLMKLLFRRGRLFISKDCPHLIEAFERAQWATRRGPDGSRIQLDTYAKDGLHEHALDAVGTGLAKLFPPFGEAAGARGDDPLQNSGILYADV